jgi:hypothetical protein
MRIAHPGKHMSARDARRKLDSRVELGDYMVNAECGGGCAKCDGDCVYYFIAACSVDDFQFAAGSTPPEGAAALAAIGNHRDLGFIHPWNAR